MLQIRIFILTLLISSLGSVLGIGIQQDHSFTIQMSKEVLDKEFKELQEGYMQRYCIALQRSFLTIFRGALNFSSGESLDFVQTGLIFTFTDFCFGALPQENVCKCYKKSWDLHLS